MRKEDIFKEVKMMGQQGFGKLYGVNMQDIVDEFKKLNPNYNLQAENKTKQEVINTIENIANETNSFEKIAKELKTKEEYVKTKLLSAYGVYFLL